MSASEALDFGFDSFTFAEVLSPLAPIAQLPVAHATQSVVVTPAESVTTMLPKDYDKSLLSTRYQLTSEAGLDAPLEAGQAVGVVQEYYGSICVGQTDLVTVTGVERNGLWGRGDAGQRRDCSKSLAIRRHCVGGTAGHFSPAPDLVHLGPAAQPKAAPKSEKGELKDAGLASIGSNLPGMYPVRPV